MRQISNGEIFQVDPAWIWLPVGSRALLLLKEASLRSAPRRPFHHCGHGNGMNESYDNDCASRGSSRLCQEHTVSMDRPRIN